MEDASGPENDGAGSVISLILVPSDRVKHLAVLAVADTRQFELLLQKRPRHLFVIGDRKIDVRHQHVSKHDVLALSTDRPTETTTQNRCAPLAAGDRKIRLSHLARLCAAIDQVRNNE